ncbi:AmiR/NasT family two-component response regulator [Isoptericola sp. CG 20/1183]|uniref:AmiR/NasT family two-component response regulator n=1 Tax=Isoptericola halotolerans TaxID=300560 RepID=A0ABX5ECQ7_9MICO|nr:MULTISPECIES: PAS and ANTAR domain-containing protein [unclassified Isoptericola]MCK0115703.1 PAS and ANTAR domain-containing protein [Isoptericola sp. S6320L]PRZ02648.1 AmiR/NasT family two-component response regulator [Isoptericola sp. CG 20/1183]PRZ03000.1 AmiR/NasT family two-component response regulator [Isoptericola halotolerans]
MSFDEPDARRGRRGAGPTGRYRLDLATRTWWWSDDIYALHGFAPGEVVPTTDLVLAHHHPDDRPRTARFLAAARRTDKPFGAMYRLIGADGTERSVVVGGMVEPVSDGGELVLHGYATDVSTTVEERAGAVANQQIRASARSRGVIEQAKGALAAVYRISPESAFEVMRVASNDQNTPLREIAEAALDAATSSTSGRRARLDDLLAGVPAQDGRSPRGAGARSVTAS